MELKVLMADPAGNRTAIVLSPVEPGERAAVAGRIMDMKELSAEQVGFETAPRKVKHPADGRLEMMGGEFCGNAARSYGMYLCMKNGTDSCMVEVSGAKKALRVDADRDAGTAAVQMPVPERVKYVNVAGTDYPVAASTGISHLIANGLAPSEEFEDLVLERHGDDADAFGIQYIMFSVPGDDEEVEETDDNRISRSHHEHWFTLTPVVYVKATGTKVAESSCASGSMAAAWYMSRDDSDGVFTYHFDEPGGRLTAVVDKTGKKVACSITGPVKLEEVKDIDI